MEHKSESDSENKETEVTNTEHGNSPVFKEYLEDDFLDSLAVVDSWNPEDDEEVQKHKDREKGGSGSRSRRSRDRKDRRSSERKGSSYVRGRSRDRGQNFRRERSGENFRSSRYRNSPRRNDRSPREAVENRDSSRTKHILDKNQKKSPDDKRSRERERPPRRSNPYERSSKNGEKEEEKTMKDDPLAGTSEQSSMKLPLSAEPVIAIDTCIKEITDVVPPGTEEEFVNLAVGKHQAFQNQKPELNENNRRKSTPQSERKELERNGRKKSPERIRTSETLEYKRSDTFKRYTRSASREKRSPVIKRRSRSREGRLPISTRRSRSREGRLPISTRRSRSREGRLPISIRRSRSREKRLPISTGRSRSREKRLPINTGRSRSREKRLPISTGRSRSREKRLPLSTGRSRSREKRLPINTKRSRSREKLAAAVKNRSKSRERRLYSIKRKIKASRSPAKKRGKGASSIHDPARSYRGIDAELSPVSGTSLSSPSLSLSPVSSEGERWRATIRRNPQRHSSPSLSLSSSDHSDRTPRRKRSPFWKEIERKFAAQDRAKSHFAANIPQQQQNFFPNKPVTYPPEAYPGYPPPTEYYPTPIQPPPPGDFTIPPPIAYPPPVPCPVPPPGQPVQPVLPVQPPVQPVQPPIQPVQPPVQPVQPPVQPVPPPVQPVPPPVLQLEAGVRFTPQGLPQGPVSWPQLGDAPKWEPKEEGDALIPPPPPDISSSAHEKSLSSLLEASAKAGVKKPPSVEHSVVNRCEEALRTLSADRGLVLSSSGSFVFHRSKGPSKPLPPGRFVSPLLKKPDPVLSFTTPPAGSLPKKGFSEEKPSLLVKAASKLSGKDVAAHPTTAVRDEAPGTIPPPCFDCAERASKKFVDSCIQTSVNSRTVALQCDTIRGEIKAYFEPELGGETSLVYRRSGEPYPPLPPPPKGILKTTHR